MKKIIIIFISIPFILLCFRSPLFSDDKEAFNWQEGEELTYKVKWSFIRLGTLKVQVMDTSRINGELVHDVRFFIDSNPMIFFVNMHNEYRSFIDEKFRLHLFHAVERIDGTFYRTTYRYDYTDSLIYVTMTDVDDTLKTIYKEVPFENRILDGTSMIFYARAHTHKAHADTLYSIFESEIGKVAIRFTDKNDDVSLINDETVPSHYLDGTILLTGIAGVTGPFKGWFSRDPQRVPLKAELKVFIGSVKVELESWKNWRGSDFSP